MSKKCPRCESKDIHITEYPAPTDSMATCYGCGYADLAERFPEQTLFDRITASMDVLAESVVYTYEMAIGGSMFRVYWTSPFVENFYLDKSEAIAATVERFKEVRNG